MATQFRVDDDVRNVLKKATIGKTSVQLVGQLPRPLYDKVNKVLVAAGGRWNKKARAHLFPSDPRRILGLAIETGRATNLKQLHQQFFTPAPLAREMVSMADLEGDSRVLEPSAGMGAIADVIRLNTENVVLIESDPVCCQHLRESGYPAVIEADFLKERPKNYQSPFDAVIMNPPFSNGQDVTHVLHACGFLRPRGRLIAVMSLSAMFRKSRASIEFKSLFETHGGTSRPLPAGMFSHSGTPVATLLITMQRP
jgi:ribosomal RNA adenine dimethylase